MVPSVGEVNTPFASGSSIQFDTTGTVVPGTDTRSDIFRLRQYPVDVVRIRNAVQYPVHQCTGETTRLGTAVVVDRVRLNGVKDNA